jgi:hypothetical protein
MDYYLSYDIEYKRTFNGVLIDSRSAIPAIAGQLGSVIKSFIDKEIALVTPEVLPYKIESSNGNLAGYFTIRLNSHSGFLFQYQLRPPFVQFNAEISQIINNFIKSNSFSQDYTF